MKRLALLLCSLVASWPLAAQEWPNWRGTSTNSGYSAETITLPLLPAWSDQTPKIQENGLVVGGGVVYVAGSDGYLYAKHSDSQEAVEGFPLQIAAGYNLSTPAFTKGKIFVRHSDGLLYGYEALNGMLLPGFPKPCGNATSAPFCGPVIANEKIYSSGANDSLYAFHTNNGETVSGFPVYVGPDTYGSSPAVSGGIVYFSSSEGRIFAFNADNGTALAGFPISTIPAARKRVPTTLPPHLQRPMGVNSSSLTVADGKLYVFAGDDMLYAYSALTGQKVAGYPVTTGGSNLGFYGSPAVADGVVYIFCLDGQLYAFDANTGTTMSGFPVSLNPDGSRNFSSPVATKDLVFIGAGESKTVYAIAAAKTAAAGKIRWSHTFSLEDEVGFSLCSPTLADGKLFVSINNGGVWAFRTNSEWSRGSLIINEGAATTISQQVVLTIDPGINSTTAVTKMMISNDPFFRGAAWENMAESKAWLLPEGIGKHTVYARFKDLDDKLSEIVWATIERSGPPSSVTGLTATAIDPYNINLTWTNPGDAAWKGTVVVRKTGGYPATFEDGTVVYNGTNAGVSDKELQPNTTYYYAAFAYDNDGLYSVAITSSQHFATTKQVVIPVVTNMIAAFGPPSVANAWTPYSVTLTADRFGVSEKDFSAILASVRLFRFRLETSDNRDVAGLDSVRVGNLYMTNFTTGLENWSAGGDGTLLWLSAGGQPGGYLQISDWGSGDWFYAVAPASWSGDWRSLIGQDIKFYFRSSHPDYAAHIEIDGENGKRLILSIDPSRGKGGSHVELRVALSEGSSTADVLVMLSSSNPECVPTPEVVTIPRNETFVTTRISLPDHSTACYSVLSATASGYGSTNLTFEVDAGSAPVEGRAVLTGRVTDATTGAGIPSATVAVAGFTTATDAYGYYRVDNIPADILLANFSASPLNGKSPLSVRFYDLSNIGYHGVSVTAGGYYRYESYVTFSLSETKNLDFSLSPEMTAGEMRLVLNWGSMPRDLDLHVYTPAIDGRNHEVYWNAVGSKTYAPYVYLDHDDQDGFGPETITIAKPVSGVYRCYVENYSTSPTLSTSSGVVQIYTTDGLVQTVNVPGSGSGLYWYICDINGSTGAITVRNTLQNSSPSGALAKRMEKESSSSLQEDTAAITSWAWDFENDGIVDDTRQNPDHTYIKPGLYSVTLRASDGSKTVTVTKEKYITVQPDVELNVAWFKQYGATSANLYGVHAVDTLRAWAAGEKGVILKTADGGATWYSANTFSHFNIKAISFVDENTGWAVGADTKGNAVIIKTENNGSSWTLLSGSSNLKLNANYMISEQVGWNAGDGGKIEKTLNGGSNWSNLPGSVAVSLRGVHFANSVTGWVAGDNGTLLKTMDGGTTWTAQSSGTTAALTSVFFFDDQSGWATTADGKVLLTRNGGVNWTAKTVAESSLLDVHFENEFHGYAVGNSGSIYKTYDGGDTWSKDYSGTTYKLNSLHLMTSTCAWAVGDAGTILRLRRGTILPGTVAGLTAQATGTSTISLTWSNPTDPYFAGTIIVRKLGSYPTHPEDGSQIYNGKAGAFVDTGLAAKTTYYYTAFTYNSAGQFSEPGSASRAYATTQAGMDLFGWKLTISSIDAGGFSKIKAFVSVVDSATSTPVTDLNAGHFTVQEDGYVESPINVELVSTGSGARADIVFVFDVTGSMGGEISGLKAKASAFADALASRGIDYRLGLVSYGDEIRSSNDFTDNITTFKTWIDGLSASGGGDTKENSLEGLAKATTLSFRTISQRIAILITDADYHEAGESGGGTTSYTTESMTALLNSLHIVTNVVGPNQSQFHQLAGETGGLWFNIDSDFQAIIDRISSILSSQYVVTYTTHHAARDNTWRNVLITARRDSKGGYSTDKYFVAGELGQVYNMAAVAMSFDKIYCRWSLPAVKNYAGVRVLRKTGGYPSGPSDGTMAYDGTAYGFIDKNLDPETIYYYRAFTYDGSGHFSEASEYAQAWARTYPIWMLSGNWATQSSGTSKDLFAISALDSARAWVVGSDGAHLRSENGGTSWESRFTNSAYTLHDIAMYNGSTGWIAGQNGDQSLNLKSNSGGMSWTAWPSSSSKPLYAIDMVTATLGWQVGAQGHIEKTTDGGASWSQQYSSVDKTFYSVEFVDELTGWVVGTQGTILKTGDGGATWTAQTSGVTTTLNSAYFLNPQLGWIATADGKVLTTADGGSSWTGKTVSSTSLNSIVFTNILQGWTVGDGGAIYRTSDGGETWAKESSSVSTDLNDIYMISSLQGWIVGDNGVIIKLFTNTSTPTALSGLLVNCTSIDAEAFPKVKCFVTVVDATARTAVSGLTAEHFKVKEDGISESPIAVEAMSTTSGARADIVFVFDTTGSMGDEITGLKQRAFAFADALLAKGVQYRLGLVTFGDAVDQVHDFTTDVAEFKAWIEGLRASGGGDVKENALEGMARATKLSFRATTQKIAVLITDAPYHQAGETSGGGTTTYTTDTMITLLQEQRLVTHVVGPDQSQFHQLAEKTGGIWFNITGNFGTIVDSIGSLLTSQYVVTYTSHDPVPSGIWRNVLITAEKEGKGGYDAGRYVVGTSQLKLAPETIIGKPGLAFSVNVDAVALTNLGLCHFIVTYDPAKVRYTKYSAAAFLSQDGADTPLFTVTKDTVAGRVDITATRVGAGSGANGSGTICTLDFSIKVENCTSELAFTSVDLRTPGNTAIVVTTGKTQIQAVKTTALLGDLDNDSDIDLKDFILLSSYWQPKNDSRGDIGPATGAVPSLTTVKDGLVNFEDLFVFTRMWNWYKSTMAAAGTAALGKVNPVVQWQALAGAAQNNVTTTLQAMSVDHLAMGHLLIQYDPVQLSAVSIQPGEMLSATEATLAFFVDHDAGRGRIDIAFSRMIESGDPELHGQGALLRIQWQQANPYTAPSISLAQVDLRSADNSAMAVNFERDFSLQNLALPTQFELMQNYPNPFNSRTELRFKTPVESRVTITICNILGQPVRVLLDQTCAAGNHRVVWDGKNELGREVVSGVYIVRMEAPGFASHRVMAFVK